MLNFIGTETRFRVLLKTRFWFTAQVVGKSREAPLLIKGSGTRIEHSCNELGLDKVSQAPPFPYQVGKLDDLVSQGGSGRLVFVHQFGKQLLILIRIFTGNRTASENTPCFKALRPLHLRLRTTELFSRPLCWCSGRFEWF